MAPKIFNAIERKRGNEQVRLGVVQPPKDFLP